MVKIRIYGAGGLGREVATFLKEQNESIVLDFIVDAAYHIDQFVDGIEVFPDTALEKDSQVIIALGDPQAKCGIVERIDKSVTYKSIIHATAYVAGDTKIGEGCILAPGVVVSIKSNIGKHVLLNYNCTLGHDVKLGDFVSVFPGATISGNVTVGDRVMIGANSSIKEGVTIISDTIIGMGAVVLNDITEPGTYVGNPIRKIK